MDLLPVFNRQLLLTDRLKSVQFLMFFACERTTITSFQFLEVLTNNLRHSELSKYVYINNIHYYASYLVHSRKVKNNAAVKFIELVMEFATKQLQAKKPMGNIEDINLRQHLDDNETIMQLLQMLIYVCTHRPLVYNKVQLQLNQLLNAAKKICLFEAFVHPEIWARFVQGREDLYQEQSGIQSEHLPFEGKFNVAPLLELGNRIDLCYRFSDLPPLSRKRKASYAL